MEQRHPNVALGRKYNKPEEHATADISLDAWLVPQVQY
jgi:hypothetical protein